MPAHLLDEEHRPVTIEDECGRRLSLVVGEPDQIEIQGVDQQTLARLLMGALWLEFISANRYRLIVERSTLADEQFEQIEFDAADVDLLRARRRPRFLPMSLSWACAARLATHPGFDQLISLPMVREMQLLEHQTRTAMTVLRRLRGRAMLCDEVGLGKTVEAGLVLSELLMRGLVRNVLVLTPPSLIAQWQGEMRRKFAVELISHDDPAFREAGSWSGHDRIIASIHTAKREPHRSAILRGGGTWSSSTRHIICAIARRHFGNSLASCRNNTCCCSPRHRCRTISRSCLTS